jgi:hypothetical protein
MTSYTVSGNVREQLGVEGAVEISAAQADAINIVAANIDAIVTVADNLGVTGFPDLASVVNACVSAQNNASGSANQAAVSAQAAAGSAAGVGSSASAAAGSASDAALSAASAQASEDAASNIADTAAVSAASASTSAVLAQRYVNDPAGTQVEPGKYSLLTYISQIQALLAAAPVLAGRLINDAGISGIQVVNLATTDFFHTIEVNRAIGHDVRFKCLQGLFTGPPPSGQARSYAWVHLIRSGDGDLYVEGPNAPGGGTVITVFRPKRIARGTADASVPAPGTATAVTGTVSTLAVPSATARRVVVVVHATYHTQAPAAEPVHAIAVSSPNIVGLAQAATVGEGSTTGASPILTRIFTGTLADAAGGGAGPALTDLALAYDFGPFLARGRVEAYVFQDSPAQEGAVATAAPGTPASISQPFTCSGADSVILSSAAFRRAGATTQTVAASSSPATPDPDDLSWPAVSLFAQQFDLGYVTQQDAGLVATTYTHTATPTNVMGAATIAGVVLRPRTVTTVTPGDDGLITDSPKPFKIATKGGQAWVLAASDGTTFYAEQ